MGDEKFNYNPLIVGFDLFCKVAVKLLASAVTPLIQRAPHHTKNLVLNPSQDVWGGVNTNYKYKYKMRWVSQCSSVAGLHLNRNRRRSE